MILHSIHIPVMGICYTVDSPIRVAPFGITSVISLVDDGLLEVYRMAYAQREGIDVGAPEKERAARIRTYLDFVSDQVERRFSALQAMRLGGGSTPQFSNGSSSSINDKDRYFLMLPPESPLRKEYESVCAKTGLARVGAEAALSAKMRMGEIQANIMVSLNHLDAALDAVRGFASSKVKGSLVLSAGINLSVFEEIAKYRSFYRLRSNVADGSEDIEPEKRIILKVSDFRSALTQGRFLAKKNLEVYEYRIESGVNCGGHAFFAGRKLLPDVLREFVAKKQELYESTRSLILKSAEGTALSFDGPVVAQNLQALAQGSTFRVVPPNEPSRITAQGGICTADEVAQVLSMGADGVGVGTPFLLVPQATSADRETRRRLAAATAADVHVSHASPLGVPFMNLRTSTAAEICREKSARILAAYAEGRSCGTLAAAEVAQDSAVEGLSPNGTQDSAKNLLLSSKEKCAVPLPGFPCRQHYLCREIPGFSHPVCMSSREYEMQRLAEIDAKEASGVYTCAAAEQLRKETLERECICRFLGNAGREEIRERSPAMHYEPREIAAARKQVPVEREPVTVCPSPSIAYFDREYTLLEMMRHLYGTGASLVPSNKPHAFDIEKAMMESFS